MEDVIKKLKFKDNGTIVHATSELARSFIDFGLKNGFQKKSGNSNVLVFVLNKFEAEKFLKESLSTIERDGIFWIAFPKGSSKLKPDINRDTLRMAAEQYGVTAVTAISLDETWSALRFRPIDCVGK